MNRRSIRHRFERARLPWHWAALTVLAAAGAGLLSAYGGGYVAAGLAFAIVALGLAGRTEWILPSLLILLIGAATDALPGPSVGGGTNLAMLALLPLCWLAGWRQLGGVPSAVRWASLLLSLCWAVATLRGLWLGAPARPTLRFGIDFLVFAALVPLASVALRDAEVRRRFLILGAALAVWVAGVNIAGSLGWLPSDGWFAHAYRATPTGDVFRLYTLSSDFMIAAVPFAFAGALFMNGFRARAWCGGLLLLLLVAVILEQGRVKYAALAFAFLAATAVWVRRDAIARAATIAAVAVVAFAGAASVPALDGVTRAVEGRVSSLLGGADRAAPGETDTLAYRNRAKESIRATLTTQDWVVGFGYRPDGWYRFAPDPIGSLRNSDLGWYNPLLTMGLMGVVAIYGLVLFALVGIWRLRSSSAPRWLLVGSWAYGVYALAGSATLVTLFSPAGAVGSAFALGLGLATSAQAGGTANEPGA